MKKIELIPPSPDWRCLQCGEVGNLSALEEMQIEINKKYSKRCPKCGSEAIISWSALERVCTKT
ncbi:MAG: hypothetical protein V1892_02315 [bacterium]